MSDSQSAHMHKHDVLTQLTIIRGHVEMLTSGACGDLPPQAQAAVEKINTAAKQLVALHEQA